MDRIGRLSLNKKIWIAFLFAIILILPSNIAWEIRLIDIDDEGNALPENCMPSMPSDFSLYENLENFFGITTGIWGDTEYIIKEFAAQYLSTDKSMEQQLHGLVQELQTYLLSEKIMDDYLAIPLQDMNKQRDILKQELVVITGETQKISSTNPNWLKDAITKTYDLHNVIVSQKKIDTLDTLISDIPVDLQNALALLLYAINEATILINQATQNITSAEKVFLEKNRDTLADEQGFEIPGISDIFMNLIKGPLLQTIEKKDNEIISRYQKIINKVEIPKIFTASIIILESIKNVLPILLRYQNFDDQLLFCDPMNLIILGGKDENKYIHDYILSLDLGGNDNYTNNAGGAQQGVSLCIDLAGDDHYQNNRNSQGAGFLGIGILIDVTGNDTYISQSWSQGSACSGLGFLADVWGNDAYISEKYAQGSALGDGLGIAFDYKGNDLWFSTSYSQGKASEDALGCLLDAFGDDTYIAYDNSQGRGLSQGEGLLVDILGDDSYLSNTCSQGCGDRGGDTGPSMGVLVDTDGDDRYTSHDSSQGFGRYLGIGFLLDGGGDDNYSATSSSQAFGGLAGIGMLTDLWGDDVYSRITTVDYVDIGLSFQLDTAGANHYCTPNQNSTDLLNRLRNNIFSFFLEDGSGVWTGEIFGFFRE